MSKTLDQAVPMPAKIDYNEINDFFTKNIEKDISLYDLYDEIIDILGTNQFVYTDTQDGILGKIISVRFPKSGRGTGSLEITISMKNNLTQTEERFINYIWDPENREIIYDEDYGYWKLIWKEK